MDLKGWDANGLLEVLQPCSEGTRPPPFHYCLETSFCPGLGKAPLLACLEEGFSRGFQFLPFCSYSFGVCLADRSVFGIAGGDHLQKVGEFADEFLGVREQTFGRVFTGLGVWAEETVRPLAKP